MSVVLVRTLGRLQLDNTLDERQACLMQERRYLAVAVRGSEAQGGRRGEGGKLGDALISLERTDRRKEMARMYGTRASNTEEQCLLLWCGGGREVGGKIKVPASRTGACFRPVRWSRSSGTSTATNTQRLRPRDYRGLTHDATGCSGTRKMGLSILQGTRTRPRRLGS